MTIRPGAPMPEQNAEERPPGGLRYDIDVMGDAVMGPQAQMAAAAQAASSNAPIDAPGEDDWYANLVDLIEPERLRAIGMEVWDQLEVAKGADRQRDDMLEAGIKRLGLDRSEQTRDVPFPGATALRNPLLAQTCVEFYSRSMAELCPPGGPAKGTIVGGKETPELREKADRVAAFENWQLTTQMSEWVVEQGRCLMLLGVEGENYTRMWYDPRAMRPRYTYKSSAEVVMPFDAADEQTSPIVGIKLSIFPGEAQGYIDNGLWAAHEIMRAKTAERSRSEETSGKLVGKDAADAGRTEALQPVEYWECTVRLSLPEIDPDGESEWLITVAAATQDVVALRRNWREEDKTRVRIRRIFAWRMFPWRGRAIGFTHLIGGLADGATGALRGLLDGAHRQNAGGGFITKRGGSRNARSFTYEPGKYVELDLVGGERIQDNIYEPGAAGPSPVLFDLMGALNEMGRQFGTVALQDLTDENGNTPVGTTLARVEEGSRIYGQVFRNLHTTLKLVLNELHDINRETLEDQLAAWEFQAPPVTVADFDRIIDIELVSDPKSFSHVQRIMQGQLALELTEVAAARGVEVDHREAVLTSGRASGLTNLDALFPPPKDPINLPEAPWNENVAVITGMPLQCGEQDDHMLHWQIHLPILLLPGVGTSPEGQKLIMHSVEHLGKAMDQQMMQVQEQMMMTKQKAAQIEQSVADFRQRFMLQPRLDPEAMQAAQEQITADQKQVTDAEQQIGQQRTMLVQQYAQMVAQLAPALQPPDAEGVNKLAEAELQKVEAKKMEIQADLEADMTRLREELKADKEKLAAQLAVELEKIEAKRQADREKNASGERIKAADLADKAVARERDAARFAEQQDRDDMRTLEAEGRADMRSADAEERADRRTGEDREFQREIRQGDNQD